MHGNRRRRDGKKKYAEGTKKIGQKFTVKWKNEYDRKYVLKDKRLNEINLIEKKQFDLVV